MKKTSFLMSVRESGSVLPRKDLLFIITVEQEEHVHTKFRKYLTEVDEHFHDLRTVKFLGDLPDVIVNNEHGVVEIDATNNVGGYDVALVKEAA